MLWKCCTQYASKFGKLSSGHRTGKGQFSFQSQRSKSEVAQSCPTLSDPTRLLCPWDFPGKSTGVGCHCFLLIPKKGNAKKCSHYCTTALISHASKCSKFSKWGFNSTWTMNFQMFKLDLEKAEEPEIKLPTSTGSLKKQESSRKISTSALLTMPKPLTAGSQQTVENSSQVILHQTTLPASWEICMEIKKQQKQTWNSRLVPNWEMNTSRLYTVTLFNLYAEFIMRNAGLVEAQAGIKIAGRSINNFRYADNTTLMAESEEELKSLLMKVKEGAWKSWLKAQYSEN